MTPLKKGQLREEDRGERIHLENIDPLEPKLLMQAHNLNDDDLVHLIAQVRTIAIQYD